MREWGGRGQSRPGEDPARERVAVGVESAGAKAEDLVARADPRSIDELLPAHAPDHASGHVDHAGPVGVGHLSGLAPEQGRPHLQARPAQALDDRHDDLGVESLLGDVVEQRQGPSAVDQEIVGAVVHEVGGHIRHPARLEPEVELGAGAVHRGGKQEGLRLEFGASASQHPVRPAHHSRETVRKTAHPGAPGRAHQRPEPRLHRMRASEVDAGVAVAHQPRAWRGLRHSRSRSSLVGLGMSGNRPPRWRSSRQWTTGSSNWVPAPRPSSLSAASTDSARR